MNDKRIPVTILTGFLGAGKTTLLNKLIKQNSDKKLAVIENEFGEINIDSELVVGVDDGIFQLSSGCICCELNDELVNVLQKLLDSSHKMDHLIVETTGIADPAPVATSFLSDPKIAVNFRLDAIITVVDALQVHQQLGDQEEVSRQIALADVVLINKTDLVDASLKETVIQTIQSVNSLAEVKECQFGEVPGLNLLDINAFSKNSVLKTNFEEVYDKRKKQKFSLSKESLAMPASPSILSRNQKALKHSDIKSYSMTFSEPLDIAKFNILMNTLLNRKSMPLYRVKGILNFNGLHEKMVYQAVNNQFINESGGVWKAEEDKLSKIVFIGKNISKEQIDKEFRLCFYDNTFDITDFYLKVIKLSQIK